MLPAAARFAPGSDKRQAQRGAEAPLLRTVPERKAVPAAPVETPDQAQASLRPLPLHMTGLRKRRPELLGPVSYTHLQMKKRHVTLFSENIDSVLHQQAVLGSVSYTHLDVYKRQAWV